MENVQKERTVKYRLAEVEQRLQELARLEPLVEALILLEERKALLLLISSDDRIHEELKNRL
jgi:hypothetical protein